MHQLEYKGYEEITHLFRRKQKKETEIIKELPALLVNLLQTYKIFLKELYMKSEQLEIDVLKRQNREMAIKMQLYRTENQQLKTKNQELNQWVGNLSEVFSTVSASWESITTLEETLLTLMKKKSDMKDKTMLRKYQNHFKTFADIINNLSDKIKNTGHSDQNTQQAKEQLHSFVNNYQLLFKQFIETYFKYNEEYGKLLSDLTQRQDIQSNMKNIVTKNLENCSKLKQFEVYIKSLKDNFQKFQNYNTEKLLEGIVQKKEQEIQILKERLQIVERRLKIMFDYNTASVNMQIEAKEGDFECVCGGVQLTYMKSVWEEKLKNLTENACKTGQQKSNGVRIETNEMLQSKIAAIEKEKQDLIKRNAILLQQISKKSVQNKLTQEMILKSSVYLSLKEQCQYLMDYATQLLGKLKKQQDFLFLIEKVRDQQIKQVKRRAEKSKASDEKPNNSNGSNFQSPLQLFKSDALTLIKNLINTYQQLSKKNVQNEQRLNNFKETFLQIRKNNDELNKKVTELQNKQLSKTQGFQFKYEKYKELETVAQGLIEKDAPQVLQLWKQFIIHVKARDKKIKDLESSLRKKERQIAEKAKIEELMNETVNQTDKNYISNKQKLDKTLEFIKNFEEELVKLAEENYQIRNQLQEEKNLIGLRLKAETQARNKLEQKISLISKIQAQFTQLKQNESRIRKDYDIWLEKHKQELENCKKTLLEKQITNKNLIQESNQKQRQIQKLQKEKQTLGSKTRQLENQISVINTTTQIDNLKLELNQYKRKIMCSCTGDRQRQVVLKSCPHLFCKRCIEDTTTNRNRKCPLCGIRFTKTDIHEIKWN